MRVLILGGSTEASALAQRLAGDSRFEATLSLAGRTSAPKPQPITTRTGGFGGTQGLSRWLRDNATNAVIDATHPYADRISANAVAACREIGVPLASIVRAAWEMRSGDDWHVVPSTEAAAAALGQRAQRVFLSLGRLELGAFVKAPQHHYVARVIDPPDVALPPNMSFLRARGPFDQAAEISLLKDEKIEIIVSKNSGGHATYAKIEAARVLALPIVMIARHDKPAGYVVSSPEAAIAWLLQQPAHDRGSFSLRGV
ncbi:cobalt-precorrin-6A reductase [Reyranella sp.]|jgi:precorrin-6A/cobalt-precorrin-6A reductase|uniref:cobalt-precorrin-6A reductase n=1 Tax=Reyranella sp. TaxID=1929291 RepID=UPI000BCDE523|nr:cobalt-precorrin-6A reductase [Reyranella sp.]OYY33868.1 MAG: cobalt-precorrin-6A reductase [Rhodospirillales bacterium 35-66-84]OYZ90872.1 MAG: cobalt-precorrin-6A reductase [Rhodospirillales bacterium 24-66-33]OZB21185.1 MAG: cobalt-precorrin-6A reductase [Rhodospirillales bacterium 39-66-50]HQS19262.1 cobalt-precorrin-6A reductase [Reyranella sp.]HQT15535.1 cobalt-precorrin-6A reductase [Reyranella sp.]